MEIDFNQLRKNLQSDYNAIAPILQEATNLLHEDVNPQAQNIADSAKRALQSFYDNIVMLICVYDNNEIDSLSDELDLVQIDLLDSE